ncbi:glycosyltransferase [Corticibacterium sp. UT-5YL-CI-8]|nr:glycosyltransferase [Tianweitania sp. UT-5YL-CI-8]
MLAKDNQHSRWRRDAGSNLLIYAPVPVFREGGKLFVEAQAANGLQLWADHFDRVVAMMPEAPSRPRGSWVPAEQALPPSGRIVIEPLPYAYRPDIFLRELAPTARRISQLIEEADYLSFAIGGLFGDWGAISALTARRMKRRFAVWTDRVESEVVRRSAGEGPLRSRLRARLTHRPMAWLERHVIRRAALGLFHGRETYEAYSSFCSNPQIVHDIHLKKSDHIGSSDLRHKLDHCHEDPLRIVYAGRADAMKAPMDWIETLERLAERGVAFKAVWLGNGDLYDRLVSRIELSGLGDRVSAPGFVSDRRAVLRALREAHVFLFCHRTPESPRCLIEALSSACPIVGYESPYAADLISTAGGGVLVPIGGTGRLADCLASLATDRDRLRQLILHASQDGEPFDEVSVFRHRSELIKDHLAPGALAQAG